MLYIIKSDTIYKILGTFEDTMKYIIDNKLTIIAEFEDMDELTITIKCK